MRKSTQKISFGTLATASFWLVVLTGIALAIPFDVQAPYRSISEILIIFPALSFIRNTHFWSAQLFLIFSFIHVYQHLHFKTKVGLKRGIAARLSLGAGIIFMAMLSGFLLKGDADSEQARQILQTLTERIPIIGESLAFSLLGAPDSYLLIYVHHIATFTVFIAVIIIEHSRKIWPTAIDFLLTSLLTALLSFVFSAPLHDGLSAAVKGPWYFVGFQEILHWLQHPTWSLLAGAMLLVLLYLANRSRGRIYFYSKRSLLIFTTLYLFLTIIGLFYRGAGWKWCMPGDNAYSTQVLHNFRSPRVVLQADFPIEEAESSPLVMGRKESCLVCHSETHGLSASHSPQAVGCASCHGGNPFAMAKNQAHRNMIIIPGNLQTARQSCGNINCHPEITERISTSLMSTLSGMISTNRYVFDEAITPDELSSVHQLKNTPADEHLRNLCVRCHLGNPKSETGPINESSRGGGCLACHLNYSREAENQWRNKAKQPATVHPQINLQVSNHHCFGCHSRSGRISTNYEGWHETTLQPEEIDDTLQYRLVEGVRVFEKQTADVHHKRGMECIDCHHSYELMGDGTLHAHKEQQTDVRCIDCHFENRANTISSSQLDRESATIAALRFGNIENRTFLKTGRKGFPLINTEIKGDSLLVFGKNSHLKWTPKKPAAVCSRNGAHSSLSCSACHSAWTPTCIGCHTEYDTNEPSFNMITNREQLGGWVEYTGEYKALLPSLGLRKEGEQEEIIPVSPGMVLSIDIGSYTQEGKVIFHRLYAPVEPHTTTAEGRACKSCHNSPLALGYGEGKLSYSIQNGKGIWTFTPKYANSRDGLPEDAWIGFLNERRGKVATRSNVFPLSIELQKKILTVGSCLTCHEDHSSIMKKTLSDFDTVMKQRSTECIIPIWTSE